MIITADAPFRAPRWLAPMVILAVVLIARWQTFLDPVLGFDEQYYLLVAHQMAHGALPYVDIWDRKPIGLFLVYALALVPGGDPFVAYKVLAALVVAATALAIQRAARREAGWFGATLAALLYVVWLNFMEGEGGQAPVFFNLPVLLAALLVRRVAERRAALFWPGMTAMALIGLALQLKYTVVFEGAFFGLVLVLFGWRLWGPSTRLAGAVLAWAGVAVTPTALAWAVYAAMGHGAAFFFANFTSIFGKLDDPLDERLLGLAAIVGIVTPLVVVAVLGWKLGTRARHHRGGIGGAMQHRPGRFAHYWAVAAAFGVVAFGSFLSPNYALPLVPPLCLAAAPWLGASRKGRVTAAALLALGLIGGIMVVRQVIAGKGTRAQAMAVAEAARPRHGGCIWVWDGYPALYQLTGSCVPTRWAFPGHLNTQNEASPAAIGVDPRTEVARILAARPEVIVDDYPPYNLGNRQTRAMVQAALQQSYRLVARIETGKGRFRLVYRRR